MDDDHRHDQLNAAIQRRDAVQERVSRLKGRLAAAQEEQDRVEQECRERGVEPDQLDAAISQLDGRFTKAVTAFEKDITTAEGQIGPFVQEDRS